MHAFPQNDFYSGSGSPIFCDDCRKQAIRDRHDAGNDDLAALLLADLPHAADTDAQVIEHALGDGYEFLARRGDPTRRVLRSNSRTPSTSSTRLMVRVKRRLRSS